MRFGAPGISIYRFFCSIHSKTILLEAYCELCSCATIRIQFIRRLFGLVFAIIRIQFLQEAHFARVWHHLDVSVLAYEDGEAVVGVPDLQLQVAAEQRIRHQRGVELEHAHLRVDKQLHLGTVLGAQLLQPVNKRQEKIKIK